MPTDIPLFLLPAFAGVPATPPEQMALKRARQRMVKLLGLLACVANANPPITGTGVADSILLTPTAH